MSQPPVDPERIADDTARRLVAGWFTTVGLAAAQQLAGAPWLVHKLTDPVGMAIGAFIAFRLRARTATVVLGGLAVSQGAEFLMDLVSGAPAIHGFGAHMALMLPNADADRRFMEMLRVRRGSYATRWQLS